jgi:hypothetical protein
MCRTRELGGNVEMAPLAGLCGLRVDILAKERRRGIPHRGEGNEKQGHESEEDRNGPLDETGGSQDVGMLPGALRGVKALAGD